MIVFTVITVALFVRPETDEPRRADAVVILGPGLNGERLREGLRLMRQGFGDVLVVSKARDKDWTAADRLCSGSDRFEVVCFQASPYTTRGEARAVAHLASRHGWSSLLIVTSTYHVARARLLNDRCHSGRIDVVGAAPHASLTQWANRVAHEWGGLAHARVVARSC